MFLCEFWKIIQGSYLRKPFVNSYNEKISLRVKNTSVPRKGCNKILFLGAHAIDTCTFNLRNNRKIIKKTLKSFE